MFRSISGARFRIVKALCGAALLALALAGVWKVCIADQPPSLSTLESRLPESLTLAAAAARIEAADAVLQRTKANSGPHYFAESATGPRSDVVSIAYGNNSIFRYGQRAGISLPLLGTRDREQEDILAARADSELRRIDLAAERRILLATLRESYIQYWQYAEDESVASHFLTLDRQAVAPARALRKIGFWTEANLLTFLDGIYRVKTDLSTFQSDRSIALAKLRAVADEKLEPFDPTEPDIPSNCGLDKDRVVASALTTDGQMRRLDTEIARRTASLDLVRWSSVDGSVQMGLGGYTDAPRGLGYALTVDVSLNMPFHRKVAEQAFKKALRDEIQTFRDEEEQRRRDLIADVEATLADLVNAKSALAHAIVDAAAKREALRVARIRFANLPQKGAAAFDEVQQRTIESYGSERAVMDARAQVYLESNRLLLLAPDACAGSSSTNAGEEGTTR